MMDDNTLLKPGVVPSSITDLNFGWDFNQPLNPGDIPSSVSTFDLGWHYSHDISHLEHINITRY